MTATAGQSVTLSGSYSDPGGSVSFGGIAWDTNYNGDTFNSTTSGTLTPNVTFSTPGDYQVALRITDSTGANDISVLNVTVQPVGYSGPTATAGTDQTLNEGDTAAFSGSYTDPDGTVSPQNIAWDFNYDGVAFNPMTTGSLTPTYQFTTPGDYTVALQVTDSNGMTSLSMLDVTVNAVPPTVSAGSNMTVTAGQLVPMSGSASVPSGASDPLSYAWDFNYDGTTFNPGAANILNPYQVFTTLGTYTVALQATDSEGVSSLSTITVTVNSSNSLVIAAGPDQALSEGDTASFAGSYSDGSGTVDPSTAQWDFNYNGSSFVADPSASGTLTPAHQFTTPGTYLVALQLTDSNNVTSIGTLYVAVADVDPSADAGDDQTVNQGSTVSFTGSASEPAGANDPLSYAWDFDYDGNNFVAAPNTNTLTPTYVYTTPGTYEAALQVTDAYGEVSLETATITVNDVPPTATISNSGPINAGSTVTFTVSNLQDQTPGDTPSYLADWTGSGQFEELTPDELTTNPDGSISFTHTYDAPSGISGYNAVVQIVDGSGGATNYTSNVVVNDPTPALTFRPNVPSQNQNSNVIDATVPFVFDVSDPSLTQTQAGFTYYVSLDGGAYSSSSSPAYLLPSNISMGTHTVTGYVQDSLGVQSMPVTWTGTVQAPQVIFHNIGSGQLQLSWAGGGPVTLGAGQQQTINGTAAGLSVTLLTSGATYDLETNGSIDSISVASGVVGVQLSVDTGINFTSQPMWVGDGHVGTIRVPIHSMVSVSARGDLGGIAGPSSNGTLTGVHVSDLVFANLDGSITGVDSISTLTASGWLGTSASQVVESATGISSLSAYGVGAIVYSDLRQDAGDMAMALSVSEGGMPGELDAGNVSGMDIEGDSNTFFVNYLEGPATTRGVKDATFKETNVNAFIKAQNDYDQLTFAGNTPQKIAFIRVKSQSGKNGFINTLTVKSGLTVPGNAANNTSGDIEVAQKIGTIQVDAGNLTASRILAPEGIGTITVSKGNLTLTGWPGFVNKIDTSSIGSLNVARDLTAYIEERYLISAST